MRWLWATPVLAVELLAGAATAVIFYAEYIGLGAQLDAAWLAEGLGNLGYGNVMAIAAAACACLFALVLQGAYLAGPRAASAVVLSASLAQVAARQALDVETQIAAFAIALCAAAAVLLVGTLAAVRRTVERLPPALVHGFNFSTAVFIVADGVRRSVVDCGEADGPTVWAVFTAAVLLGLLWNPVCEIVAAVSQRAWLARFTPLGMLAAAALAWVAYDTTSLSLGDGASCGRFGAQALHLDVLAARGRTVWATVSAGLPASVWLPALACGAAAGFVLLLECVTAFVSVDGGPQAGQTARTRWMVVANLVGAGAGVGPVSYSASRTHALRLFGGRTRLSVLSHAGCTVALALLAGPWMASIPQFAIGVLLVLVGLQMVTPGMARFWRDCHVPTSSAAGVQAAACFWLGVATAVLSDSALLGFVAGGLGWFAAWGLQRARAGRAKVGTA